METFRARITSLPTVHEINRQSIRVPVEQYFQGLEEAKNILELKCFGYELGKVKSKFPDPLDKLMICSHNLHESIDHYINYYSFDNRTPDAPRYYFQGDFVCLEYPVPKISVEALTIFCESKIAETSMFISKALGNPMVGATIDLPIPEPDSHQFISQITKAAVNYNTDSMRFFIKRKALARAFLSYDENMKKVFENMVKFDIAKSSSEFPIVERVYKILSSSENLRATSLQSVANQLNVSEKTLSKNLEEAGTGFRELLSNFKNIKTVQMLCQGEGIDAITYYLGFSERAAFDRAFKKWQGITASQFKKNYNKLSSHPNTPKKMDLESVPSLPKIAQDVLEMTNQEDFCIEQLISTVEKDPILTAKLISLSNSAFYGTFSNKSLRDAVIKVFGVDVLRNMAISMLTNNSFNTEHSKKFSLMAYWLHSLSTAHLSLTLCRLTPALKMKASELSLIGQLHNIGALYIAQHHGAILDECFEQEMLYCAIPEVCSVLQDTIGIDPYETGAILLAHWKMPMHFSSILRKIRHNDTAGEFGVEAAVLLTAEHFSRKLTIKQETDTDFALEQFSSLIQADSDELKDCIATHQQKFELLRAEAAEIVL